MEKDKLNKVVVYNGKKYRASGTNSKYYYADSYESGKRKKEALHRRIYSDNFGGIPDGFDVHHLDGNTENNNPDNLKCIKRSIHRSSHQKERMLNPIYKQNAINALDENRDKSKEWHRSDEGKKWHTQHGISSWKSRDKIKKQCKLCQKEFETFLERSQFCSNKCWQRNRYKEKTDFETRICVQCGKEFEVRKNEKCTSCSRKCSSIYWRKNRIKLE
jgi:hypothetical protein